MKKVIIVDDDFAIIEKAKEYADKKSSINLEFFLDDKKFFKKIKKMKECDLFVFDYRMPTFSGFDLAYEVINKGIKSKIIIFTYSKKNIPDEDLDFLRTHNVKILEKTNFTPFYNEIDSI